jgi:hypothetical protein
MSDTPPSPIENGPPRPSVVDRTWTAPPTPEAIDRIADQILRGRAEECWRAVSRLRATLEAWDTWWLWMWSHGDADPGLASRYHQIAREDIYALHLNQIESPPFNVESYQDIVRILPPVPSGLLGGPSYRPDGKGGYVTVKELSWQELPPFSHDGSFWYFGNPGKDRFLDFHGELFRLKERLRNYPLTLFAANATPPAVPEETDAFLCTQNALCKFLKRSVHGKIIETLKSEGIVKNYRKANPDNSKSPLWVVLADRKEHERARSYFRTGPRGPKDDGETVE